MNAKKRILGGRVLAQVVSACALCTSLATPAIGQDDQSVEVTEYGTVTLAVQDTDLTQVLEMLSIQSQKNIITSKSVAATISANLYDVTFYEALDAILKVNGYDYIEEGNFIYIYTQQEMEALAAATRRTESRIYQLNYLSAGDANELITPLLSGDGRSSFRGDVQPGIEPDTSDAGQDSWAFAAMLVVNDYPDELDAIADLLEHLDVPPKQVLIEATILQTRLDEANAWGIDFNIISSLDFTDLTDPLSAVDNLLGGTDSAGFQPTDNSARALQSTPGNTTGPGTLKIGLISNDLSFFLRMLDEVTDSIVLARPKIMCLNRQRAEVLVGRRVGYISTTATETSTTQTVEFLDTGINLMFRPFISENNMIRLEMAPSVSEAFLRDQTNAEGVSVTIPDELTNELTTNVRIQDGHTLVLGGLFRESSTITRRQTPYLGDIPVIGAAFRGQDDSVTREEIIFLITPTVVHDEKLWAMGEANENYMEAVIVGSRSGLLPWSKEKTSANQNTRAIDAFAGDEVDEALYHINNSLRINPDQPEIIRFRERVLGSKAAPHERNITERVIREELGGLPPIGTKDTSSFAPKTRPFAAADDDLAWIVASIDDAISDDADNDPSDRDGMTGSAWTDEAWNEDDWTAVTEKDGPAADAATEFDFDDADDRPFAFEVVETSRTTSGWAYPPAESSNDFSGFETVEAIETVEAAGTTPDMWYTPDEHFPFEVIESTTEAFMPSRHDDVRRAFPADSASANTDANAVSSNARKNDFRFAIVEPSRNATPRSVTLVAGTAATEAAEDKFVDRFIREYFTSLGLADLSSFGEPGFESTRPFATFDDIIKEIVPETSEATESKN